MSRPRNPNDLIRIEDAIKVLCRKTCHPGIACPDIYCKEMWDEFEDVERVDAVEVVRCKDCSHAHMTFDGMCKYCDVWFPDDAVYVDGDYYCGSSERKDGEHDKG